MLVGREFLEEESLQAYLRLEFGLDLLADDVRLIELHLLLYGRIEGGPDIASSRFSRDKGSRILEG